MAHTGIPRAAFDTQSRPRTKRHRYEILRNKLDLERSSWREQWRDLNDFFSPTRGRFFISDRNRGDRRNFRIHDTTPSLSARVFSSGVMSGLTSPARPWFRLALPDFALMKIPSVKQWLNTVTERMRAVLIKSNVYKVMPTHYKDWAVFSTACTFMQEDFEDVIRMTSLPIGSYMIGNDRRGKVNVMMRDFAMTVQQIVDEFGRRSLDWNDIDWTNISLRTRDLWLKGQYEEWIDVVHVIKANENFDEERLGSRFKKFSSDTYERGLSGQTGQNALTDTIDDMFLRESGFDEWPVLATRWESVGEDVYGKDGPGMIAIGDNRQLQTGERRGAQALEKSINPALMGPTALKSMKVSILPGDITYLDQREGQAGLRPVHEVTPRLQDLEFKQTMVRRRIEDAFFVRMFLLMASDDRNRNVTAREVEEKHSEKLLMLGPALESLNQEFLDPLINFTFSAMDRQGRIPEPPPEIAGMDLKVEYISIMAQAQKLAALGGLERFLADVMQMANLDPAILDKVDRDLVIDKLADILGIDPDIVLSDEMVDQIRAIRQQQEAEAARAAQIESGARTAKDLSQADVSGDNALRRLIDAAEASNIQPT